MKKIGKLPLNSFLKKFATQGPAKAIADSGFSKQYIYKVLKTEKVEIKEDCLTHNGLVYKRRPRAFKHPLPDDVHLVLENLACIRATIKKKNGAFTDLCKFYNDIDKDYLGKWLKKRGCQSVFIDGRHFWQKDGINY
jgi:hypothetical protein